MDKAFREGLFKQAKTWILEAGANIRERINEPLAIDTKSNPNDLVTTMDKETEKFFASKIRDTYPDHFILSEEGFGDKLDSLDGTVWIIDPIDGTMNFVHQKKNFAISIGIFHNGKGEIGLIYDVMNDVLYSAQKDEGAYKGETRLQPLGDHIRPEEAMIGLNHFWLCENRLVNQDIMQQLVKRVRGTRTYGSAALEFAYVAEGIMDGYLTMSLAPWDVAAGIVIVNEVGGVTTDMDGNQLNLLGKSSVITCNPSLQELIIQEYLQKAKK